MSVRLLAAVASISAWFMDGPALPVVLADRVQLQ